MLHRPLSRLLALITGAIVSLLALASANAASDRKFVTTPTLSVEARTLVNLLEQAHYNRDAVEPADYGQVVENYMGDLDGQRLFFLATDKQKFNEKYGGKAIYWNLYSLGNIDAAYDIFRLYEDRTHARINWIFDELNKDFDLSVN